MPRRPVLVQTRAGERLQAEMERWSQRMTDVRSYLECGTFESAEWNAVGAQYRAARETCFAAEWAEVFHRALGEGRDDLA